MSRHSRLARPSAVLAAVALALVGLAAGPVAHPKAVDAATASYIENKILGWVNQARANHHVAPLTVGDKLARMAQARANTMAKSGVLKHPDCLSCVMNAYDVDYSRCGEVIAYTSWPWGYQAAKSIYEGWKGSPGHWTLLMSPSYHRVGFGVAYRGSGHITFASGDLAG